MSNGLNITVYYIGIQTRQCRCWQWLCIDEHVSSLTHTLDWQYCVSTRWFRYFTCSIRWNITNSCSLPFLCNIDCRRQHKIKTGHSYLVWCHTSYLHEVRECFVQIVSQASAASLCQQIYHHHHHHQQQQRQQDCTKWQHIDSDANVNKNVAAFVKKNSCLAAETAPDHKIT